MPAARKNLTVDPQIAAQLVARFRPVVRAIMKALYRQVPDQAALVSAGDEAIIIAYQSHDPDKANLDTWTRHKIRWYLAEAARQPPIADVAFDPVDPRLLNGADPEEQFWRATATRAVERLDPRKATIIIARMHDETYEEIADSIGVSAQRTHKVAKQAIRELREILESDSID